MLELIGAVLVGTLLGAVTGSIPGIHPNTVIFSSFPVYFSLGIPMPLYLCFIAGISVSHTFHDFLPAIYLSAPSAESAMASLPGRKMMTEGRGREAFSYTVLGGLSAVILFAVATPVLLLLLKPVYSYASILMPVILLFFLFFILIRKFSASAFLVSGLSGALGILAFRMPVNQDLVLMPVFTGLFAVPAVVEAWRSDLVIPEQEEKNASFSRAGSIAGFASGLLAGTVPGVGAGAATSFLSPVIEDIEEVMTGLGAVNTTDIFVSFVTLFVLGKARSGASVALQALGEVSRSLLLTSLGASFLGAGLAALISLKTHDIFLRAVKIADIDAVLVLVLSFISVLTFIFLGFPGLLILFTASIIGLLAWRNGCRMVSMSVLIIPAFLFYLGIGIFI
ncbi:MAG: tripartite tricarboxylate transporter permease [Candidatus Nanohalobium sp.]